MWPWPRFTIQACRESSVVKPVEMRAISDAVLCRSSGSLGWGMDYIDLDIGGGNFDMVVPGDRMGGTVFEKRRHNGLFNTVYCDGHVEALRRQQFSSWQSETMLRQWNNDDQPHWELVNQNNLPEQWPP